MLLFFGGGDFTAVIMAAGGADMVRPLQLAAIRTFRIGFRAQGMVRTAHVALRRRGFSFWNRHGDNLSWSFRQASFAPAKERPR